MILEMTGSNLNKYTMNKIPFTKAEIFAQSIRNLNYYITLTMVYLKEKGQPVEDWLNFLGQKFIQTWPEVLEDDLEEIGWGIVLNNLSGGASLISFSGDNSKVEMIFEGWPPDEILNVAGLSWEESQIIHEVLQPVFSENGLNYAWKIEGKQVKIELSKK